MAPWDHSHGVRSGTCRGRRGRRAGLGAADQPHRDGRAGRRDLIVHGDRLYVANQKSDTVDIFTLGPDGLPVPADSIATGSPTSVLVVP
jgi:hypothetical protein